MSRELTAERLRKALDYDPDTGIFTRRYTQGGRKIGDAAGSTSVHGYRVIKIDGRQYRAHRLAWLYVHGRWPRDQIDHINRDKTDNRIANLREATNGQNNANVGASRRNLRGVRGVGTHHSGKYLAYFRGKSLGLYSTAKEAESVSRAARERAYGAFST